MIYLKSLNNKANGSRFVDVTAITLRVGPEKKLTVVHKDLLCGTSAFFAAAFESLFKEGQNQTMDLPDEDPEILDQFLEWLYSKDFAGSHIFWGKDFKRRFLTTVDIDHVIKLYLIAEKYHVEQLSRSAIDVFFEARKRTYCPTKRQISHLYANTSTQAGLRKLLIDWCIRDDERDWILSKESRDWLASEPEIAADFVVALDKKMRMDKDKNSRAHWGQDVSLYYDAVCVKTKAKE